MIGSKLKDRKGRPYQITGRIGGGTQAEVYSARDKSGNIVAVKIFKGGNASEMRRAEALMKLGLPANLPVALPKAIIDSGGHQGYVTDFIAGQSLEDIFSANQFDYFAGFRIVAALWQAVAASHAAGLIHGDIQSLNIIVTPSGQVVLIDIDNFVARGVSEPPPCIGELTVIATELRMAMQSGAPAASYISEHSDVYAANALCGLLLLGDDDAYGAATPDEFNRRRLSGAWNGDPLGARKRGSGLPPEMLPQGLMSLIRQAWAGDPALRPPAEAFAKACRQILDEGTLFVCDACNQPVFADPTKTHCPHCRNPLPTPVLLIPGGRRLVIDGGVRTVGRNDLGGDSSISSVHCVLQRCGPMIRFTDRSRFGASRRNRGHGWESIPPSTPTIVQPGERLRLGNTEFQVARV